MATQQGFGLAAPSSRQDVISALLNDYGSSFGNDDGSPYSYSPALKELPPPPPSERKYSNDKPLPSLMSMKFQLRVDEPAPPASSNGSRNSSSDSQPTKIVSRSLSRSAKPPSLKLLASNGSTATLPNSPRPTLPLSAKPLPSARPEEEKDLPPPPPEKSELRKSREPQQLPQPVMGSHGSKEKRERIDSMEAARNEAEYAPLVKPSPGPAPAPVVQRKPVPKFRSLAELGQGPRGGKGGPVPLNVKPRNQSVDSDASTSASVTAMQKQERSSQSSNRSQSQEREDAPAQKPLPASQEQERSSKSSSRSGSQERQEEASRKPLPIVTQMPPTPTQDENEAPIAPPRKPFAGMGLPSNPRSKGQETPKHTRGKSSTGFDIMKGPNTRPTPNTITPGPTPSPKKTEQVQQRQAQEESPVSPLDVNEEGRRPFSFEAIPPPQQRKQQPAPAPVPTPIQPAETTSPVSPIPQPSAFPPRTTSRPQGPQNPSISQPPSSQRRPSSPGTPPATPPTDPESYIPKPPPSTPCPIKPQHLNCYSHHSTFVWSRNDFHPMPCMICHSNDKTRKWACVWCYLRICIDCSNELMKAPGRDLGSVLEKKGISLGGEKEEGAANPSFVVWDADAEDEGTGERERGRYDFS